MNVLLIGSGGREHALGWKLRQSSLLDNLYIAPGNAGTADLGKNIILQEKEEIKSFIEQKAIDVVLVGPEQPLVDGLVDYLKASLQRDCILFGPGKSGAQLEGSKDYAKGFMQKYNVPTAAYKSFTEDSLDEAIQFIHDSDTPIVLKADGLAAGKGVLIHESKEDAISDLKEMFGGKFGNASKKVVIEEFLDGIEFSVFILTDGKDYLLLPQAKDYKRIGEGDTGLNTGGMGSVSPVPFCDEEMLEKVKKQIIEPTLKGIQEEKLDYLGFIFFGLILVDNEPYVIEYNCRMGDPETQVVIPRMQGDLLKAIKACNTHSLHNVKNSIDSRAAVSVVLASGGYPVQYKKGYPISGVDSCDAIVFHAGTKQINGQLCTAGGRVMAISAYGNTLQEAQDNAYKGVNKVSFQGMTFRKDIGDDLIE